MSGTAVLVDTGPLVAIVDQSDDAHESCINALKLLSSSTQLVTTESVLTEAFHLISYVNGGSEKLFQLLRIFNAQLKPLAQYQLKRVEELMSIYNDLPMDFADATIVSTSEELGIKTIFTLDRRGFDVYRPIHVKTFSLLPQEHTQKRKK